jgi:hypothetical protein
VIVHDIKVNDVGAGINDRFDLFAQAGEVGGKKTGRYSESLGHDRVSIGDERGKLLYRAHVMLFG